jgi:DNA-binding NtrC family response regulator
MVTRQPGGAYTCGNLLAKSAKMREVFERIEAFGETDVPVLIEGESGAGKQEVARAIHQASSARRPGPLVVVNCAALPENLLEAELFGCVMSGGFSRAEGRHRPGRLELARGGTLLLCHIGEAPPRVQARLRQALQARRMVRVGDNREVELDVRAVAAVLSPGGPGDEAACPLDPRYWADALRLRVPPLRERPEDIPLLASHFARAFSGPAGPPKELSPEAVEALQRYRWPGNVRELQNVIERACVLFGGRLIGPHHLSPEHAAPR